jgi:hypothetical protein
MSLYEVDSLSNTPSLSTAVLNAVISLSNLSGLIAILPPSVSNIILQCPNIALCSELKLTGTILISLVASPPKPFGQHIKLKEQQQQKEKEQQHHHVIYKVQGKQSWWVQRESDPNLFCHVRVTTAGFGILIESDCPDAIYRKRVCKHCRWIIGKYQLSTRGSLLRR